MLDTLLIIVIVLPLFTYIWAGFKAPRYTEDLDKFFNARQAITPAEFAGSSTAYNFQVASIMFFIALGFLSPILAILNAIFWGVGIIWLFPALSRLKLHLGSRDTLFGFLGKRYNSPTLRSLAALFSICGFVGLLLVELVWGAQVFMAFTSDKTFIFFVTFSLGIFLLAYFLHGGHVSVVRTDQYQLIFAYSGLGIGALWLLLAHGSEHSSTVKAGVLLLAALLAVYYLITGLSVHREMRIEKSEEEHSILLTVLLRVLCLVAIAFFIVCLIRLPNIKMIGDVFKALKPTNLPFRRVEIISLLLLPIFWQFIDFNMWQRLGAVQITSDEKGNIDDKPIRIGLRRFAVESPISILISVTIGMTLRLVAQDYNEANIWGALISIPTTMIQEGTFGAIIAAIFAIGVVAILLSTADSALVASVAAFIYDGYPSTRKALDSPKLNPNSRTKIMRIGTISAIVIIIVGLLLYFIFTSLGYGERMLGILFGAFGIQLAIAPAVIGAVFLGSKAPTSGWALGSALLGFAGGAIALFISFYDPTWQYLPPLATLVCSIPVFTLGVIFSPQRKFMTGDNS